MVLDYISLNVSDCIKILNEKLEKEFKDNDGQSKFGKVFKLPCKTMEDFAAWEKFLARDDNYEFVVSLLTFQ